MVFGDKSRSNFNTQIYSEACEWFVEFRGSSLDASARREFDLWLRKSPEHLSAYLEIAAIWNEGASIVPPHLWDIDSLVAQAAQPDENVIWLMDADADAPEWRGENASAEAGPRRRRNLPIAAAVAALCVAVGTLLWFRLSSSPTYATAVGEQRSILLPDGSTVELNSRSKISVRYAPGERAVDLLDGQALFHVAKDPARPFVVRSDAARVRAVGTQFDVYKKRGGTIVSVVEGRVAVLTGAGDPIAAPGADAAAGARATYLAAGEQLTVTAAAVRKVARPNVATATAWTQRQIVFESASLAEVAEEFNRYNVRQIVLQDRDLDDFHISGVFSSVDPAPLIRFLRERSGVDVIETESEIRVVKNSSLGGVYKQGGSAL